MLHQVFDTPWAEPGVSSALTMCPLDAPHVLTRPKKAFSLLEMSFNLRWAPKPRKFRE